MADGDCTTCEDREGLFYLWHLQALGLLVEPWEAVDSEDCAEPYEGKPKEEWKKIFDPDGQFTAVTVAIIDNGCAGSGPAAASKGANHFEHPNLASERLIHPVDFTGFLEGAVYAGRGYDWPRIQEWIAGDQDLLDAFDAIGDPLRAVLHDILGHCLKTHKYLELPDPSDRFAAHGTACAGLVAASPAGYGKKECVDDGAATQNDASQPSAAPEPAQGEGRDRQNGSSRPLDSGADRSANRNPNAIGYAGIHPTANIIPISTVYNTEYWPLIMALLWAVGHGADVILIPRGVSDLPATEEDGGRSRPPTEKELREDLSLRGTRLLAGGARSAEKHLFETLLSVISEKIPVVMAAGNSGSDTLDYPANLVLTGKDGGGPVAENLIVVGAVNARGAHASYSAGYDARGTLFYAPSDDAQEVSDRYHRYDDITWRGRNLDMDVSVPEGAGDRGPYSPYGLMAIDIPGQYGYAAEAGEEDDFAEEGADKRPVLRTSGDRNPDDPIPYHTEVMPRSLYTVFGGTSAASCQIAGLLALLQQKQRNAGERLLSGKEAREELEKARVPAPDMERGEQDAGYGMQIVSGEALLSL